MLKIFNIQSKTSRQRQLLPVRCKLCSFLTVIGKRLVSSQIFPIIHPQLIYVGIKNILFRVIFCVLLAERVLIDDGVFGNCHFLLFCMIFHHIRSAWIARTSVNFCGNKSSTAVIQHVEIRRVRLGFLTCNEAQKMVLTLFFSLFPRGLSRIHSYDGTEGHIVGEELSFLTC